MGNATPSDPRRERWMRNFRRILTVALLLIAVGLSDHFIRPATARNPNPPAPPSSNGQSAGSGTSDGAGGGAGSRQMAWNGFLDDASAHRHRPPIPPDGWGHGRDRDRFGAGVPGGGGTIPWGGVLPVFGPDAFGSFGLPHDGIGGGRGGAGHGPGGDGSAGIGDGPSGAGGGPGGSGGPGNGAGSGPFGFGGGPGGGAGSPNGGPGGNNGNGGNGNGGNGNGGNGPLVVTANDLGPAGDRASVPEPDVTITFLAAVVVLLIAGRVAATRVSPSLRPR